MAASWRASRAFIRQFSSAASHGKPGQDPAATANMWKKIFYFVAVPAICLSQLNCYLLTKEEEANFERPEFIPYEHLRIITKPYPWADGKRGLFYNPHVNALPTGYED